MSEDQRPTIGRIVLYTLTDTNAHDINRRREFSGGHPGEHRGNSAHAGDTYPMTIVRVWGNTPGSPVNGQVHLDGTDVLWVTSTTQGQGEGHWTWPTNV